MNNHGIDNELNRKIIEHHLNHLKNKNYSEIARQLHVNENKIHTAVKTILPLDPKPGIRFQPEPKHEVIPEIFVYKKDGKFISLSSLDHHISYSNNGTQFSVRDWLFPVTIRLRPTIRVKCKSLILFAY